MSTANPTETLRHAVECVTEAARLHLLLEKNSSKDSIAGALVWRYGISKWVAGQCYDSALVLLDKLPRR